MEIETALCSYKFKGNEIVKQYIKASLNGYEVSYILTRDIEEGGNISDIEKEEISSRYIENGNIETNEILEILNNIFASYVDFEIFSIDQALYDQAPYKKEEYSITYINKNYEDLYYTINIEITSNEIVEEE